MGVSLPIAEKHDGFLSTEWVHIEARQTYVRPALILIEQRSKRNSKAFQRWNPMSDVVEGVGVPPPLKSREELDNSDM